MSLVALRRPFLFFGSRLKFQTTGRRSSIGGRSAFTVRHQDRARCAPIHRDHASEHERKSKLCFEVGNETRNPPRRGRIPMKYWGVARAQVAKKPNCKPGSVNRPADAFGVCHLTAPQFAAAVATSQEGQRQPRSGRGVRHPRWARGRRRRGGRGVSD